MPESAQKFSEAIEQAAAAWVLRLDAGLSATEEVEFAAWLAADQRHRASLEEFQRGWDRFQPLADSAARAPAPFETAAKRSAPRFLPWSLAAAATIAFGVFVFRFARPPAASVSVVAPAASVALLAPCEQRALADGSTIDLNRGAAVTVLFSATERRVQLDRGEASFTVAKDAARPFIVSAGGVEVRAVGTAFNVRFDPATVEVVVTHGTVAVENRAGSALAAALPPTGPAAPRPSPIGITLTAGQRTVVALAPTAPPPAISTMSAEDMEARLAWQPKLLDFDDAPLAVIVAEFNRRNPAHLVVPDPALGALRLTASFRSDNMEGFVRLMENNYAIRAERRSDTEIVLQRK